VEWVIEIECLGVMSYRCWVLKWSGSEGGWCVDGSATEVAYPSTTTDIPPKPSKRSKKRVRKRGDRDRQVGAFSVFGSGVYRNPVHFWAKKGLKIRKLTDLGVDVIQPRPLSRFSGFLMPNGLAWVVWPNRGRSLPSSFCFLDLFAWCSCGFIF